MTRRLVKPQPSRISVFDEAQRTIRQSPDGIWVDGHGWQVRCPYRVGQKYYVKEAWAIPDDRPLRECDFQKEDVCYAATSPQVDLENPAIRWRSPMFMPEWAARLFITPTAIGCERVREISNEHARLEGITGRDNAHRCYKGFETGYAADWSDVGKPDKYAANGHTLAESDICLGSPWAAYANLWNSINAKPKASKRNPYTGAPEICKVAYPWDGEEKVEEKNGVKIYTVPNPYVWPIEFEVKHD